MTRHDGFTLIELMIAMGVLAVTAVYLLETFTVNNRNYAALDQVIEAQQNMRAIADLIERDVRHAGLMVPEGSAACGLDSTTAPDILYVSDHEAIDPGDDIVSYRGARVTGGAWIGGDLVLTVDSLTMEPTTPPRPAYDTNGDGTADSDFQVNGGAIVADRADPGRGVSCGRVRSINVGAKTVRVRLLTGNLGPIGGATPELIVVPATEYRVDNQANLLRNGLPIAKNVEDFQVAYFFDLDGDDLIAANESRGAGTGAGYTASSLSVEDLREVRINFVSRTRLEDPRFTTGSFKAMENRVAVAGSDGFRRRVHTSTVMPRNLVNRMNVL